MNITAAQIPSTLNTAEKLAAWVGMLLHRANPNLKVLESPGSSDYACQVSIFQADDGSQRLVVRLDLQLADGWKESGAKVWTQVVPFSEIAVPAGYTN